MSTQYYNINQSSVKPPSQEWDLARGLMVALKTECCDRIIFVGNKENIKHMQILGNKQYIIHLRKGLLLELITK